MKPTVRLSSSWSELTWNVDQALGLKSDVYEWSTMFWFQGFLFRGKCWVSLFFNEDIQYVVAI